jgi:hypothetical protein
LITLTVKVAVALYEKIQQTAIAVKTVRRALVDHLSLHIIASASATDCLHTAPLQLEVSNEARLEARRSDTYCCLLIYTRLGLELRIYVGVPRPATVSRLVFQR